MKHGRTGTTEEGDGLHWLTGWRTSFLLGLVTLLLGVVVVARPTVSLIAIAVLLGIAMIASGVYHIVQALEGREHERVWRGIAGVLSLIAGLILIRHLHLTIALIGLFIGFTWVIQGVASLMVSASRGRSGGGRGWSVLFGVISVIAGIVVISSPIASVAALTIFMGIWLIVIGAMEMLGSFLLRRAEGKRPAGPVSVPEQRATTTTAATATAGGTGQDAAGQPADAGGQGTGAAGQTADAGYEPKSRNVPG